MKSLERVLSCIIGFDAGRNTLCVPLLQVTKYNGNNQDKFDYAFKLSEDLFGLLLLLQIRFQWSIWF